MFVLLLTHLDWGGVVETHYAQTNAHIEPVCITPSLLPFKF